MKRSAHYLDSDTHKRARPQPMPSLKRSAAQLFHPSKRPCVQAPAPSTLKRSAARLFHPPKRQCFHAPAPVPAPTPPPPDMHAVFAQLVQYVASLEQRIATLESMVRAPGPAEPFATQRGIVVF